ncbi:Uncharacterized protein TCAP_05064 [Tolypocladium capitatum]|uniref:DUF5672 domain-containing protein n=1 Tax=Tolypocladium capitatum TaxID=45235 RepID=A0A2K3QBS0_9HYPO|nr:Uncharacterized protein TCAP_05064 [Tolypocladium capitatum]
MRTRYNASKVALIIEPEPVPLLVPLLLHMIAVVPPDWQFLFIGSKESVFAVSRGFGIQMQQALGKLDLRILPEPWLIKTDENQIDRRAILRRISPRRGLDLKAGAARYDSHRSFTMVVMSLTAGENRPGDQAFAGYGGLSLRRVSTIKKVLRHQRRHNNSEPEDEWFEKRITSLPGEKIVTGSGAVFAVENKLTHKPMGYHAPRSRRGLDRNVWKDPKARESIFQYCPELRIIMDMKLEKQRCPGDNRQGDIIPDRDDGRRFQKGQEEDA